MTFGQKLQALRKEKGISQENLAGQLGVSRQAVSRWELDISLPETENIVKIGKIFSVSYDYLLNENAEKITVKNIIPTAQEKRTASKYNISAIICRIIFAVSLITVFVHGYGLFGLITKNTYKWRIPNSMKPTVFGRLAVIICSSLITASLGFLYRKIHKDKILYNTVHIIIWSICGILFVILENGFIVYAGLIVLAFTRKQNVHFPGSALIFMVAFIIAMLIVFAVSRYLYNKDIVTKELKAPSKREENS